MAEVTIEKLASDVGTTVDRLVQQFADAGITKNVGQMVSEDEKKSLLEHLSKQHGGGSAEPSRLTLNVSGGAGRNREIQVEVRKQKTYVKRPADDAASIAAEEARLAEERAKEEAARQEAERVAAEKRLKEEAERKADAERKAADAKKREEQRAQLAKDDPEEAARRAAKEEAKREADRIKATQEAERLRKLELDAQKQAEEARRLAEESR